MSEFMGSCVAYSIITKDDKTYRVVRDPVNVLGHFDSGECIATRIGEIPKDILDSDSVRDLMVNLFNCIEDEYLIEIGEEEAEGKSLDSFSCLEIEDPGRFEEFNSFIDKVSNEVNNILLN